MAAIFSDSEMGKQILVAGRVLGRGRTGAITILCANKETQEVYACKRVPKKSLRTAEEWEFLNREVVIMEHLPEHPNIVRLKKTCEAHDAVHLFMEFCEGGELLDRIIARGHYKEPQAAALMRTIVEAVQTCHKHGVMHRDLKPENLMFENKNEDSPLKVIDFGMSTFFKPGEKFYECMGTPCYMAPEVWMRNYGPEVDMWSAGVILYVMLSGHLPFKSKMEWKLRHKILHSTLDLEADPWPVVSESAKSLVRHMLERDPKARYNAQQVLNHPWLQNDEKN